MDGWIDRVSIRMWLKMASIASSMKAQLELTWSLLQEFQ